MLQIPTITQDDLDEFHARVYGYKAPRAQWTNYAWDLNHTELEEDTFEEEDDLGHYPDGNKRTLTDDQIAMFRHSEIYAILRERQIQRENDEANGNEETSALYDRTKTKSATEEAEPPLEEESVDQVHGNNDEKEDTNHEHHEIISKALPTGKKKRKRNNADHGDRPFTSRRMARELDSAMAGDCVLDYGDEPAEEQAPLRAHPTSLHHAGDCNETKASIQGRKIWWPVIEESSINT
ncbi:hypothetical protein ACLMJK_006942 [Lecanora helva]